MILRVILSILIILRLAVYSNVVIPNRLKYRNSQNSNRHSVLVSDSEEEIITRKKKSFKLFNDDDESDDDKKSEKGSGFVDDNSDRSQETKTQSSKANGSSSDNEPLKNSKDKSKARTSSDGECSPDNRLDKSRARSSSRSGDERSKASSSKSRSRSRSRSNTDHERSKASSQKSRSRSRSSSSSSDNRSKVNSRKSRSSSSRSSSSSGNNRSRASSRNSRSRSRSRSNTDNERSKASSQRSRSRSRSGSSSSDNRSKVHSRKSRSSSSRSSSSSSNNRSRANSRNFRSRSRSRSKSDDNRSKASSGKSRSRSRNCSSSDENRSEANTQKSRARKSSKTGDERSKHSISNKTLQNESQDAGTTLTEMVKLSNKSDDSDNEVLSVNKRSSRIIDSESDSDINYQSKKAASNNVPTAEQKSGGKFSLITESDLESEDDLPPVNRLSSDSESSNKKKKIKKLQKKKASKKSSVLKSNGMPESMNSESENEETSSSPKRPRKSGSKPKNAKKEKDPLMSIRSETQRMIREGRISLPYHQPKQHTLHEFLQRRKTAPSIPLKATSDVLRTVCEQLTIKEKETEEFFKSESEPSDAEEESNTVPASAENQSTAVDVETSVDSSSERVLKVSESVELNPASDVSENQNTATNLDPSFDCSSGNAPKATEFIKIDSSSNNDATTSTMENTENVLGEHESMDTNTTPDNPPEPTDTDIRNVTETISVQEEKSSTNLEENSEEILNQQDLPCESIPPENTITVSDETSTVFLPETIESERQIRTKSDDSTVPEKLPENIPDSVDFELQIEDSCNNTETPPQNESASADSQSINSITSKSSTEDLLPTKSITDTETKKNKAKSRLERTLALLSNHNIDLSPVNLNNFSEEIQFEIPSNELYNESYGGICKLKEKFVKHSMTKNKPRKSSTQINVVSAQKDANGEITGVTKETLVLNLDDPKSDFSDPKFSKPGTKHAYFKEKMLKNLISKKEAHWNEYQTEKRKLYGSDSEEEKSDDEETRATKKLDFEPYHPEDELDDDELIEDDVMIKEKDRKKNCYLDEEAEVSDPEDVDENVDESVQDDEEVDENTDESIYESGEDDEGNDNNEEDELLQEDNAKESDNNVAQSSNQRSADNGSQDDSMNRSLFKYNTTGIDLENKVLGLESISQMDECEDFTDSQIFGICSGKFTSQLAPSKSNTDSDFFADSQNVEDSQNICLSLPEPNKPEQNITKNRDQLFESDGSDNEELFARKKRAMRIEDSDDEFEKASINDKKSENSEPEDQDEAEDDEVAEDEDDNAANIEAEEYGYNSDEELVTYKTKVAEEFFENEAELSESEWGSEDENEGDLDKLEKEEGDDDELDNDKLKEELGKIHMRQLLDDDQHDVRMLKEMLLEDGELHSDAKRHRKFQWKNLDGDDFFLKNNNDSDDENALNDDDETEEHWRKIRHEREAFLSQQEGKSCLNELENVESTFIQLPGKTKIVNESITRVQQIVPNSAASTTDKTSPRPNAGLNSKFKCGSFLSRGKLLLSKMALSVSDTKEVSGAKNNRNFVFGTISPGKQRTSVAIEKTEKRKISNGSASVSKRIKFSLENGPNGSKRESLLAQLALSE